MVRQRNQGLELALLYLLRFLIEFGIHRIPVVTLGTVGLQIILYLGIGPSLIISDTIKDVSISWYSVMKKGQYYRIFFGQMEHANDFHLYYNIMSFVWKGYFIEKAVGFRRFFAMQMAFIFYCGFGVCFAHYLAGILYNPEYIFQGCVGFSAVIFAHKIVLSSYDPANNMGNGMRNMTQWGSWLELLLISFVNPYSSFLGHLVGILVGLEYTKGLGFGLVDFPVSITKMTAGIIETVLGLVIQMTGFEEEIDNAAENWNEQAAAQQPDPHAGQRPMFGGFGMGMGGMGMGGMGGGLFNRRYRRF